MRCTLFTWALCLALTGLNIGAWGQSDADTTWVQTFTWEEQNNPATPYDSPGRRWFEFPASENGESYQKILMYYTLKCFEDGTAGGLGYACGEWDYLTYTYLFDHTGVLDSNLVSHPRWKIDDLDFTGTQALVLSPVGGTPQDTVRATWSLPVYDWTGATWAAGEASAAVPWTAGAPFWTAGEGAAPGGARLQALFTGAELAAMGLVPGAVQALELPWDIQPEGVGRPVELRLLGTSASTLSGLVNSGWEVSTRWLAQPGVSTVPLATPWNWDGTEALLVEVVFEQAEAFLHGTVAEVAPGKTRAAVAAGNFIRFDGGDRFEVDAAALDGIGEAVTVEFWQRGNAQFQPENSTLFEAHGPAGERELNVHLPWSNGRVYWDAGYEGGYDRIDQQAAENQYEGIWNHWAFVKDATAGTMSMYLNGSLFHAGSDRDNPIGEVVRMHIGCDGWGGNDYRGDVDGFRVWAAALAPEVVAAYRSQAVDASHPAWADLRADLAFDGADGTSSEEGILHGNAGRVPHAGRDAFWREGPVEGALRPAFRLVQGGTASGTVETVYDRLEAVPPVSVTGWAVAGNGVVMTDLAYGWPVGSVARTRLEDGTVLATHPIEGSPTSYTQGQLSYYSPPFEVVERIELARYITPYGIGLTLGDDGWTWVFDVTDYAPLLRDWVELEAGNWQELLDMKFAFVHGTPARDVERVEAFWRGSFGLAGFAEAVLPHTYVPAPGEEQFRLKTRASGHGFGTGNNCAEFCYNTHSVAVNGTPQWSWEIMRECADNPLYPQGGTWIYDRAGWCPGAPVDTRDWELTPLVDPSAPFDVAYGIEYDPHGNYVMEGQIIAYGPSNFVHDLEISDILSPSDAKVESRFNPICESPRVRIRNNGTQTVTSCTFTYRVVGGAEATYTWTGELPYLASAEVALPYNDPSLTEGDDEEVQRFEVRVDLPAATPDGQTNNNASSIAFHRVPTWSYPNLDDNRIIVWTKTNLVPWETTVELRDADGEIVWSRGYTGANTTYQDTLALNAGCYRFTVRDSGDDGQAFWANNDGSGYTRLKRVAGGNFIAFEPDFGRSISQAFYFATNLVDVAEHATTARKGSVQAYPNPSDGTVYARLEGFEPGTPVAWTVRDAQGRLQAQGSWRGGLGERMRLDLASLGTGLVHIEWTQGELRCGEWILLQAD